MNLKGKKLLILGGNAASIDIVKAAQNMGVYTIVTDWYDTKRSPAKLVADEYWNEEIFRPDIISKLNQQIEEVENKQNKIINELKEKINQAQNSQHEKDKMAGNSKTEFETKKIELQTRIDFLEKQIKNINESRSKILRNMVNTSSTIFLFTIATSSFLSKLESEKSLQYFQSNPIFSI